MTIDRCFKGGQRSKYNKKTMNRNNKDARKGYGRSPQVEEYNNTLKLTKQKTLGKDMCAHCSPLSWTEMTRIQQNALKLTKKTLGEDICAHCSPLSGSKITNSGLILLVFRPLRIGRKPPRCWGIYFW